MKTTGMESLRQHMRTMIENHKASDPSKIPKNVKCNCGHTIKDHYRGGWCHSSGHPKEGKCGCTWFYPNDKWILMNNKREKL